MTEPTTDERICDALESIACTLHSLLWNYSSKGGDRRLHLPNMNFEEPSNAFMQAREMHSRVKDNAELKQYRMGEFRDDAR